MTLRRSSFVPSRIKKHVYMFAHHLYDRSVMHEIRIEAGRLIRVTTTVKKIAIYDRTRYANCNIKYAAVRVRGSSIELRLMHTTFLLQVSFITSYIHITRLIQLRVERFQKQTEVITRYLLIFLERGKVDRRDTNNSTKQSCRHGGMRICIQRDMHVSNEYTLYLCYE